LVWVSMFSILFGFPVLFTGINLYVTSKTFPEQVAK